LVERSSGIWNRATAAGVKPHHFFLSHFVQGLIIVIIQSLFCCFFLKVFVVTTASASSMSLIFLIYLLSGVFGIVSGILIATVIDDLVASMYFDLGSILISLFLSGVAWPIEGQPKLLLLVSRFWSFYYPAAAVRSIAFKGASIGFHEVMKAIALILTWIAMVCASILILTVRRGDLKSFVRPQYF
jgi:ABC-type multidrug transport system permease subunit